MAPSSFSHRHFFFLIILLLSTIALARQNIPLGSSLSTLQEKTSWVSPSGDFAFGFHRLPDKDLFLLAIWYEKIPQRTIIWCANRDNPVEKGSKVELKTNGQLVLYDHQRHEQWKPNITSNSPATSAAMLDTGNFVLFSSSNSSHLWGSFDEPTDTILPTQILGKPSNLTSRRTEADADYSNGKFQLRLEDKGVILYTIPPYGETTYFDYWETESVDSASRLVFNESGYLNLMQSNGSNISLTPGDIVPTNDFYHRTSLDFDGVLRQYVYPKTPKTRISWALSWSVVWFVPEDMCVAIISWRGSGTCGFNSYCRLDEDQKPSCTCPPGYSYLDPNNKFGGCKQDFLPQSCELGGLKESSQFELREMRNVDWPLADYEQYKPIDEGQCRQECLDDCFCAVAVFRDDTCWKKKTPLSNGKMDSTVGRKTLVKVSKSNLSPPNPHPHNPCREKNKDRTTMILIGSVLFGSSGVLNVVLLLATILVLLYSNHQKKELNHLPRPITSMLGISIYSFTFKELEQATDGFKDELSRTAFGTIYKGVLALDFRHLIAVKKLDKMADEADREFRTEVTAIGQTHHKNLVQLLGFCDEGPHRLLVYEFMSNGSLASFLFGSMKPDWNQRIQTVLGIARGLTYLHEECGTQITHCDINPQNILLDECFTARISDFGLAKIMQTDQTRSITSIRGTKGYVAPEWFKNMPITAKVDVYSFGVLLLEIICCRRNVELGLVNEEKVVLTDWAYDCYVDKRIDLLVENDEEAMNDMKRVERLVMVALWCIQENPTMRPSMVKVTEMLEGVVEVSAPMCPYSTSSLGWKSI